jgi:hypothetical protein
MTKLTGIPFSRSLDYTLYAPHVIEARSLSYHFHTHFHPYVQQLIEALNENSVEGLQAADTQRVPELRADTFAELFSPGPATDPRYPVQDLDFQGSGAYAVYNWELFYHVPITVAIHLSRNGRYEEARHWLHYIFDPTTDSDEPLPRRFWNVRPFKSADVRKVEDLLEHLSAAPPTDPLRIEIIDSIGKWRANPFRPHLVARVRQTPYMYKAVMAYLDNLIDWGDSLFRQDTGESVNEATQLYVLAANLLGPRPQVVPHKGSRQPKSYAQLKESLDAFGDALVDIEADIPFDLAPRGTTPVARGQIGTLRGIGRTLYFGVPRNDKLLGYWDTVADRLFKIRNSLNLQGVFRQLPLFEPPIDPALLARAAAAGLDVDAVVAGLDQPLPLVRFSLLIGKAAEICQEVKSLGNQLLSVIEKHDTERLALLRAQHEKAVLDMVESVKYSQWQEAIKAREGLERSLANAAARYLFLERQLHNRNPTVPELDDFDRETLGKLTFSAAEPTVTPRPLPVDIARRVNPSESGGKIISSHEARELRLLDDAHVASLVAKGFDVARTGVVLIPQFNAAGHPLGVGADTGFGGRQLASMAEGMAAIARGVSEHYTYQAGRSAKIGGYARRELDWAFQSNTIAGEITQIYKQLRAAQIREAIAERDLNNHRAQMENSAAIETFLTDEKVGKTAGVGFYAYLKREVRRLYTQCFDFAYDVAKKAERALGHELGDPSLTFIGAGQLAGKEGLLAGEKLYLDIKRMEMARYDLDSREYELTTHVSLRKLDPVALLRLRATGICTISVPEDWFDLECPGHYFRRVKSVAVSVPCVAGPYATVNCTLTQTRSAIRIVAEPGDSYASTGDDDVRFAVHSGTMSIVTSAGQNDSGLFETNLRDERYLPFEGTGAISDWTLSLPTDVPQFDHQTIADMVLHMRYTAREAGGLRGPATDRVKAKVDNASSTGSVRLLSARSEFATEWTRFKESGSLTIRLREEHYPYWASLIPDKTIKDITLYAPPGAPGDGWVDDADLGMRVRTLADVPAAIGEFTIPIADTSLTDLWLAIRWGGGATP